jgi:CMP-N-acetylneuraminic acid synthetase
MRIVGLVPSKLLSRRLPRKNVKKLGGVPLVNYVLRTLQRVERVDESVLFASEDSITRYIEPELPFRFMQRPAYLDEDQATMQDFIGEFLQRDPANVIVLLHITAPFITPDTVDRCVNAVLSGEHDSAFAAHIIQHHVWFDGKPLNYSLDMPQPRTQDLEPVVVEQGGLYVFTREVFETTGHRIGPEALIVNVNAFEGIDIDTRDDFEMAKAIISAGLAEER